MTTKNSTKSISKDSDEKTGTSKSVTKVNEKAKEATKEQTLSSAELRQKLKAHAKVETKDAEDVFQMVEVIGEGSFGTVLLCRHVFKQKNYAIKAIDFSRKLDEQELESELQELDILRESDSPFIVKFFGVYEKESTILIAMEFCSGGSISDLMSLCKRTLQEKEISSVCYCVLKALKYLHSKNVCHRDIKGGNILLTQSGYAKLTDFGVSKITDKERVMHTVVGSPYWMAPELISAGNYNLSADVWSLGITAIETAEGNPPHYELHPMRAMREIPNCDPPTLKEGKKWSKEFASFLATCLRKVPDQRPSCKDLLKVPFIKGAKKYFKKEIKALVQETIFVMTTEKRKKLAAKQQKSSGTLSQLVDQSGFISLNASQGSARTLTKAEGTLLYPTMTSNNQSTMIVHNNGTVVMKDTDEDDGFNFSSGTVVVHNQTVVVKNDFLSQQEHETQNVSLQQSLQTPSQQVVVVQKSASLGSSGSNTQAPKPSIVPSSISNATKSPSKPTSPVDSPSLSKKKK